MTDTVRAGVVGTGNMGRHHARVYAELPEATLVGVHDADAACAESVASEYGTRRLDLETLLDGVDAVSVAVPTRYHYEVARRAIDRGVAVLVEKPLAPTVEEGTRLVAAAREADVTLGVGHVERFNPAVARLLELVDRESIVAVDAQRLGPSRDGETCPVVTDLMIHDIDVLLTLLGGDVTTVQSAVTHGGQYATAILESASDTVATLTASRVTQRKVRRLTVTTESRLFVVDYVEQSLHIHRASTQAYVEDDGGIRHRDESVVEQATVGSEEPLRREVAAFLAAVRDGGDPPVTGEDGLRALDVAARVTDAAAPENVSTPEVEP